MLVTWLKGRALAVSRFLKRVFQSISKVLKPIFRFTHQLLKPIFRYIKRTNRWLSIQNNKLKWSIYKRLPLPVRKKLISLNLSSRLRHFFSKPLVQSVSGVLLIALLTGSYYLWHQSRLYNLDPAETKLLSSVSINKSLIGVADDGFTYNHKDESKGKREQTLVLANPADATGKVPYKVTLPKDAGEGITFSDSEDKYKVTMTPQFDTSNGRLTDGHVIYPSSTNERHAYTFKRNGIKEDIILSKSPNKEGNKSFSWTLNTGELEAKDMGNGAIGLYSANPMLYGDISVGDDKSQELLDNAKQNGTKDNLVFILPKPFITDSKNNVTFDNVAYKLEGNTLTLEAKELNNIPDENYPISIDPTVVVTTNQDFATGNDSGMISYPGAGNIARSDISAGAVGIWTTNKNYFSNPRTGQTSLIHNGYLYIIGGNDGSTYYNTVQYAPIQSDGSLGSWQTSGQTFATGRAQHDSFVYNGYMYITGGIQNNIGDPVCGFGPGSVYCKDVQYAQIGSDGSVGAWQTTTALPFERRGHTVTAYNGYVYLVGGYGGMALSSVHYAVIKADGTLGSWSQDGDINVTTGIVSPSTVAYNGYLYVTGGTDSAAENKVRYAPINIDGTVGDWATSSSVFTTARFDHSVLAYEGYLYIIGGSNGTYQSDVQYAPIYANGTVGTFASTTSFTTARSSLSAVTYNDRIYLMGGTIVSGTACKDTGTSTLCNDVQYTQILMPSTGGGGIVGAATQQKSPFNTARLNHSSVVYNGFLYLVGGNAAASSVAQDDIEYCALNSDGSINNCTQQTAAFTTARHGHTSVAHNGFLYILGGYGSGYRNDILFATINGNGSLSCPSGFTCTTGVFTQQTNAFSTARLGHTSVTNGGYLYIIGGSNGSLFNDIQRSSINGNGSLSCPSGFTCTTGVFTQQISAFSGVRYRHTSAVNNNYLYIVGGEVTGGVQNDVQYCPINGNGSIGSCTQQTDAFITARSGHTTIVNNSFIYIIGGDYPIDFDTGALNDVQYCPINGNGSIGSCTQQTDAFMTERSGHTSVVHNSFLYVIGGTASATLNDGHFGTLNGDGSVSCPGGFSCLSNYVLMHQSNVYATKRYGHSSVIYNGFLYIIGGYSGSNRQNNVQYCEVNADGTVSPCTLLSNSFQTSRYFHTSVAHNSYLYIIGGSSATGVNENDIQRAYINSDGSISCPSGFSCNSGVYEFTQQTGAFSNARSSHSSTVYNGYLYITGGNAGGSPQNDVQYCPINASDGSIGGCTSQSTAFVNARSGHATLAYNGYLYIIGGVFGTTGQNDILRATINTNGSLSCPSGFTCSVGVFTQQASAFTTGRYNHSSVINNGFLYIAGGSSASVAGTLQNDVQYCSVASTGVVGACTVTSNAFTSTREAHSSVVHNNYLYIIGGNNASTVYNDIQYLPLSPGTPSFGTLGTWALTGGTLQRYRSPMVAFNGFMYMVAGEDSGVNDVDTVHYAPISTDGTIGSWTQASTSMTGTRGSHKAVTYNGYLYALGGYYSATVSNTVEYALICTGNNSGVGGCGSTPGDTGTWATTTSFTTARRDFAAVVYRDSVYITGGVVPSGTCNGSGVIKCDDVQYSPICNGVNATGGCSAGAANIGKLGTWVTDSGGRFGTARSEHMTTIYNDFIYVMGGSDTASGFPLPVQYARVCDGVTTLGGCSTGAANVGTIGTWGTTTSITAAGTGRVDAMAVGHDGYIYMLAGLATICVQSAVVNADGTLGSWTTLNAPSPCRSDHGATIYNGYAYVSTGVGGADYQYVRTLSPTRKASYERIIDITKIAGSIDSIAVNGQAVCGYSMSYSTAGTDGIFGAQTHIPFMIQGINYSISTNLKRYLKLSVFMDDSRCGKQSYISDITLTYTPTIPSAPTLITQAEGVTIVGLSPSFTFRSTDASGDYLRYQFELCSNSDCSSLVAGYPITQTAGSQTGWSGQDTQTSTAYVGSDTLTSSTIATYTIQTPLSYNTQYWWRVYAKDPGDSDTFSTASSIQTFYTNYSSVAPTNSQPVSGATNVSLTPEFRMYTTDPNEDFVRYKVYLYQSDCSSLVNSFDQPTGATQTGWTGQSTQSGTAYTSGQTAIYTVQTPLTASTTYCWKASAKDAGGTNLEGALSTGTLFTTQGASPATTEVRIRGNVNIGGVTIDP